MVKCNFCEKDATYVPPVLKVGERMPLDNGGFTFVPCCDACKAQLNAGTDNAMRRMLGEGGDNGQS